MLVSERPADGIRVTSAGYSYHTKPFHVHEKRGFRSHYLMRIQTEGWSRARIAGQETLLSPGDLLLVPPGVPYELHIGEEGGAGHPFAGSGDYYMFFKGPWAEKWWKERRRPTVMQVPLDEGIVPLCRQVVVEMRRDTALSAAVVDYSMRIVCLTVDRLCLEHRPMKGNAFLAHRMKSYIEEHATTSFQLRDIAAHFSISVSRAVHLYKQFFGKSIIQYALEVRLKVARERIVYTRAPLEAIAETSGFPSYTYFYRVFKKQFGLSPKAYRLKYGTLSEGEV